MWWIIARAYDQQAHRFRVKKRERLCAHTIIRACTFPPPSLCLQDRAHALCYICMIYVEFIYHVDCMRLVFSLVFFLATSPTLGRAECARCTFSEYAFFSSNIIRSSLAVPCWGDFVCTCVCLFFVCVCFIICVLIQMAEIPVWVGIWVWARTSVCVWVCVRLHMYG